MSGCIRKNENIIRIRELTDDRVNNVVRLMPRVIIL